MAVMAHRKFLGIRQFILFGWLALVVLAIATTVLAQRYFLATSFQAGAAALHRQASQRADQHDAHLTALSALAVASAEDRPDLFLDVAATILRFYPRITAVDLVPLAPGGRLLSTRSAVPEGLAQAIRSAASDAGAEISLQPAAWADGHYLLVKRSPNSDAARYGLAMEIDAAALLASEDRYWQGPSVSVDLLLSGATPEPLRTAQTGLSYEKALGSASQPLLFQASLAPSFAERFPLRLLLPVVLVATLLYFAAVIGIHQWSNARQSERRARLSAQEARLAHASRVNGLGEMASGMAHELTQPLTAVLAQAQAGRHLAERGDIDGLRASLDSIIVQTKRAAALLDRLRNWSRPQKMPVGPVSVNAVARNVQMLLQADADRAGIDLAVVQDPAARPVRADAIEVEQVVFNLVRNAMDAVTGASVRQVRIVTRSEGILTVLEVEDSGPGVVPEIRPHLFEPFVTGTDGGTGLGLALCQRLVDSMGGDIALVADAAHTTFRMSLPALQDNVEGTVA